MDNRESIIAKVKKCLALGSKGANTTEAEMATALGMAKRLMAKFNLSEAEVLAAGSTPESIAMASRVAPTRQKAHKYEKFLAVVCEYLFSAKPLLGSRGEFIKDKYKVFEEITFHGTETDVMLAVSAFELLRNTINEMALNCGYRESERDQWRVGVVVTLLKRAKEAADGLTKSEAEQCRALVVTRDQLVKTYIAEKVGKTKAARRTTQRVTGAYLKGQRDGNKINTDFRGEPDAAAKQLN